MTQPTEHKGPPDQGASPEVRPAENPTQRYAGHVALQGVGMSAQHFYGGNEHFMGRKPDGSHSLVVTKAIGAIAEHEVVGRGDDVEAALQSSLDTMRAQETIRTPSLARIELTDSQSVSFTSLEQYKPRVAPSREPHATPDNLKLMLESEKSSDSTYRNTQTKEGWQAELLDVVANYLMTDATGQQIVRDLNIHSLRHLTPEQAVKLSTTFVQNVSKYSLEDVSAEGPTRADKSTAAELLKEGIAKRRDPDWGGNGVCRNIASNVRSVFDALKQSQAELSMLNNTYCVFSVGEDGSGYQDSRPSAHITKLKSEDGHAWNTFVTVDSGGSATATIVDATWALGADSNSGSDPLDYTEVRAAAQMVKLFESSETKQEAFQGLAIYLERLVRNSRKQGVDTVTQTNIQEYAVTSYLKAAAMLPRIDDGATIPDSFMSIAYGMRGKLEHREVESLFVLSQPVDSTDRERFKRIISGYDAERKTIIPRWQRADNLVFEDSDLQNLAYEAVGDERITLSAEQSGKFRARLREMRPEALPPFDATKNQADAMELRYFAGLNGIHEKDPKTIMSRFTGSLKRVIAKAAGEEAGVSEAIFDAIVAGRSDYELAKNFKTITAPLYRRIARTSPHIKM